MLNIVLLEPEIPANTGNIGRTCVASGTRLHLIEPLGFSLSEKALKRAGMDYWKDLDVTTYIDYQDFLDKNPGAKIYMRRSIWRPLRHRNYIRKFLMRTTVISCSGKRARGYPKRFSYRIRKTVSEYR